MCEGRERFCLEKAHDAKLAALRSPLAEGEQSGLSAPFQL